MGAAGLASPELVAPLEHPVYDGVYLGVAEQICDQLLTGQRFVRAVASTGHAERVRELGR